MLEHAEVVGDLLFEVLQCYCRDDGVGQGIPNWCCTWEKGKFKAIDAALWYLEGIFVVVSGAVGFWH